MQELSLTFGLQPKGTTQGDKNSYLPKYVCVRARGEKSGVSGVFGSVCSQRCQFEGRPGRVKPRWAPSRSADDPQECE